MRRLSVARDRELRHAAAEQVSWRWSWREQQRYAWCRICNRDTTARMITLIDLGYIDLPILQPLGNVKTNDTATAYLERYPR